MNWFKKKRWNKPFSEKIARRVRKIRTGELVMWADQSVFELGRLLSEYERHRSDQIMDELLQGAEAVHAIVDELNNRLHQNNI